MTFELVIYKESDRLHIAVFFKNLKYPVPPCEFMAVSHLGYLGIQFGNHETNIIFSATLFLVAP